MLHFVVTFHNVALCQFILLVMYVLGECASLCCHFSQCRSMSVHINGDVYVR